MQGFEQELTIRWSDLDPNFHVKHTSYADFCATARFRYLEEKGFGMAWMMKHSIGPVILKEELQYMSELRAMDRVKVNVTLSAYSEDGKKWELSHDVFRQDGTLTAKVVVFGIWFDQVKRKSTPPPEDLKNFLGSTPRSSDFRML